MTKSKIEQLAEDYSNNKWGIRNETPENYLETKVDFTAGYKAAQMVDVAGVLIDIVEKDEDGYIYDIYQIRSKIEVLLEKLK